MDEQNAATLVNEEATSRLRRFWLRGKSAILVVGTVFLLGVAFWLITTPSLPAWTNFNDKGLWDVLDLIIVPVALAIGGYFLSTRQKATELEIARRQRESEQHIAKDREEEQALQTYFNEMSKLLFEYQLPESKEDSEQRSIARSRTLTTLRRLNPERKAALLLFLYEAKLIEEDTTMVSLLYADLREVKLKGAVLRGANLTRTNLRGANLEYVNLEHANLKDANLASANLKDANLVSADLRGANMKEANLRGARLDDVSYNELTDWPDDITPPPMATPKVQSIT
jgi:hypothetical protein